MIGCRRYRTKGIANFRDLGGYPCDGGITSWGVFYRSTSLHMAEPEDLQLLQQLNIRQILDLRAEEEREEKPDRYPQQISCRAVSLLGPTPTGELRVNSAVAETKTLIRMYRKIIRYAKTEIGAAVKTMIHTEGAALFHCAAGKDRTGILAMLLLGSVGVGRADIIADYEISHNYISAFTDDCSGTHRSNMETLYDEIEQSYGTVNGFLSVCGVSDEELLLLHKRFVTVSY